MLDEMSSGGPVTPWLCPELEGVEEISYRAFDAVYT